MRGFDRTEVVAFLSELADEYEQALRENDRLQEELGRLQGTIEEHREHERNLRNTLLTAQRLADEIRSNAEQEGARVVREAEGRAELILQKAQARIEDIQREIDTLRMKRREVEGSLESTITALKNSLEFVRDQEHRDRDEKILLHRPRPVDPIAEVRPPAAEGLPQAKTQ